MKNTTRNKFLKIPRNNKGTDYAVGDIHGCFSLLLETLDKIGFNKKTDRLFCVGDLCDRGPESHRIVEFLSYPWVFSVQGNHEQILQLYEFGTIDDEKMVRFGSGWWLTTPKEERAKVLKAINKLPLVIELETNLGKVGILHAECPVADWDNLEDALYGMNGVKFSNKVLWGVGSVNNSYEFKNIDAIIVGHMTIPQHQVKGNMYLLDTGAVFSDGHFSILNINTLSLVNY